MSSYKLGLKSEIRLPNELRQFFSDLEFHSKSGKQFISLDQHGDGIKVQHIPIILRWLAEQANTLSSKGKPQVTTIWGYEEPENNVEIKKCFDLANDFYEASKDIQTFITTHSPVFYTVFQDKKTQLVSIFQIDNKESGSSARPIKVDDPTHVGALNTSLGFLELLRPYIQQEKERADRLEVMSRKYNRSIPSVFVEGPSDKEILSAAISKFAPSLADKINVLCSTENGGGHGWVKDNICAWHHSTDTTCRAVGLFDADAAAEKSISDLPEPIRNGQGKDAFHHVIKRDGIVRKIVQLDSKIAVPTSIEEICPIEAWREAYDKSWLVSRENIGMLCNFNETDRTLSAFLNEKLNDEELILVVLNKVHKEHKKDFSKFVAKKIKEASCNWDFTPLKHLVEDITKKLRIATPEG